MNRRLPKNVAGDFYTTGECLACALPEMEAPQLLAELSDNNFDTYFVKQPETAEEITQAIAAARICCTEAVRYRGKDKSIIKRLPSELSDYKISSDGAVIPANEP